MKIPESPKSYLEFGSTIHHVLEQLTKMQKNKQVIDETIAGELLDKCWNTKNYTDDVKQKNDYAEAKKLLKIFLDEQSKSTTEILDIEREFKTAIGTVHVRGVIDRIDKDTTGFTIIDYKTSKTPTSIAKLKEDIQMLVYALAFKDMYGSENPLTVGEWFLRTNKKVFFSHEKQAIEKMKEDIQKMAKNISSAIFNTTQDRYNCRKCDYKIICD